ncbi:MAG: hypothetical protein QM730_19880 [Anaerolineales bacterium]
MDKTGQNLQAVNLLLNRISELAMMWRGQPENHNAIKSEYHETYEKLRILGWDDTFDIDCELPDEHMPKEYIEAHPHIPSNTPWQASWRTSEAIKEINQERKQKKSLLRKLKDWLK